MSDILTVSQMFRDHAVLQRYKNATVYGEGIPGTTVQVKLYRESMPSERDITQSDGTQRDGTRSDITQSDGTQSQETIQADALVTESGRWKLFLPPCKAGGPYNLAITDGSTRLQYQDIYFGDVWFAGGQSNMELELQGVANAKEEIKNARYPMIRFYNVVKAGVLSQEIYEQQERQTWKLCLPENVKDVSGVAYFAAREIYQKEQVPIGVIDCYIGGTSATCWMDDETLASTEETREYVQDYLAKVGDKTNETYLQEMADYQKEVEAWNQRLSHQRELTPDANWEFLNEKIGPFPWPEPAGLISRFRPGNPYKAMVTRVIPYSIRGFWYYQGEEDTYKADQYDVLMRLLIENFREKWEDQTLPFFLNQLPVFLEKGKTDDGSFALLRQMQQKTADEIPNTYMNCLIDCGEFDNIHPVDKQTVGKRLGQLTLRYSYAHPKSFEEVRVKEAVYDEVDRSVNVTVHVPAGVEEPKMLNSMEARTVNSAEENTVVLQEKAVTLQEKAVTLREKVIEEPLPDWVPAGRSLFEIQKTDGSWSAVKAQDVTIEQNQIRLKSVAERPVRLRYAFQNYCKVTIFDQNELPLRPFDVEVK